RLRRRHQHLPEHRRRQSGSDGDGELAARRRSPARAHGGLLRGGDRSRSVSEVAVAGTEQGGHVEIACREQRVAVVTLGGGLRSYEVGGGGPLGDRERRGEGKGGGL